MLALPSHIPPQWLWFMAEEVQSATAAIGAAEYRRGWLPLGVIEYGGQPYKKEMNSPYCGLVGEHISDPEPSQLDMGGKGICLLIFDKARQSHDVW